MSYNFAYRTGVGPLLVFCAFLGACSKPDSVAEPQRAVRVLTVRESGLTDRAEFAAELSPRAESRLGFRVGGKVLSRPVQVGSHVKAGELLAQLDAQDYRLAAQASTAQLGAAQTNRDLALAELKRYQGLREQNFISSAELERREANYKSAQSQLEQAQAQSSSQGNQTAYTTLRADVSGIVTAVDMEVGQVLAAGSPVVRIAQDGARDAVFALPEDQIAAIKPGLPMDVRVWATKAVLPGVVREVAPSADPVTRTFSVKVEIKGKEVPALGTTVSVLPRPGVAASSPGVKLPTPALFYRDSKAWVWLLQTDAGVVRAAPVEVAGVDGNEAVIRSGLKAGDVVVTAGVHVLSEGQKVVVYQPSKPMDAPNK